MVMTEHLMEEHIQGNTWLLYNRKTVCAGDTDRIDRKEQRRATDILHLLHDTIWKSEIVQRT